LGAAFSRDERRILTWSDDKTARLWDMEPALVQATPADLVRRACARLPKSGVGSSTQDVGLFEEALSTARRVLGLSPPDVPISHRLDDVEINAIPILKGRLGEDVCAGV
jgi:hypothetical protein